MAFSNGFDISLQIQQSRTQVQSEMSAKTHERAKWRNASCQQGTIDELALVKFPRHHRDAESFVGLFYAFSECADLTNELCETP